MDSPSSASQPHERPSSVPAAMQGGGTLSRTLAVGWHLALRIWPAAAIAAVPSLVAHLSDGSSAPGKTTWREYAAYVLTLLLDALIAASLLPSVMRWFADAREITTLRGPDLRRRAAPALAAALAKAMFALPLSLVFFRQLKPPEGAWLLVTLLVVFVVGVWIQLRLMLMVAVAVVERCSALAAVRRSWALTRGWLLTMLGVGFVLAMGWLLPIIVSTMAAHGHPSDPDRFSWSAAVSQVVLMPWFFAFVAVLYHDARILHDDVGSRRIAEDAASD